MKKLVFVFFCFVINFSANAQEYNLLNGITLNEQNRQNSYTAVFHNETPFQSTWDRGRVMRYSNNEDNVTGLGRFVEIKYEMGFVFGESFMSQGQMTVIFSNLSEINVNENTIISKGTLIGKTKKGSGNELRVFVLSDTEDLQFLRIWTNNNKTKIGDYWYWNPSFLFK